MVGHRSVDGDGLLPSFHVPELRQRRFLSLERLVWVFRSVVQLVSTFRIGAIPNHMLRCVIRPEAVHQDHLWTAITLYPTLHESEWGPAVSACGYNTSDTSPS